METFKTHKSNVKYSHRRWEVRSYPVETPDGEQKWEQIRSHAPAVVVVPENAEGTIGLIAQNRVKSDGKCHIVWEFPSGWMDVKNQDVTEEQVVAEGNRELGEETGFVADQLSLLAQFQLSNFAMMPFYTMVARGLKPSELQRDAGEQIQVRWVTVDEADQILLRDQIPTSQVYIAFNEYKNSLKKSP